MMTLADRRELSGPWQVVVIGAGPAGAVCAFRLAREGKKVLLVDRAIFPRSKVCGSCISARTLEHLRAAGLASVIDEHMELVQAPVISQINLCTASGAVPLPLPPGRALSRASLDLAIIEQAQSAGAVFAPGLTAFVQDYNEEPNQNQTGLRRIILQQVSQFAQTESRLADSSPSTEIKIETQCVVVADGVGGQSLGQLSGQEKEDLYPVVSTASRIGAGCVVVDSSTIGDEFYKRGIIYMALHKCGYVGAVRLEQNKIDVGAAFDLEFVRKSRGAGLAAKTIMEASGMPFLDSFDRSHWLGTAPFTRRRHKPAGRQLFVIGDAASYGEPFTGEGIGWAINSALLVVPYVLAAVEKWDDRLAMAWQKEQAQTIVESQKTSLQLGKLLRQSQISAQMVEGVLRHIPTLSQKFLAPKNKSKNLAGTR